MIAVTESFEFSAAHRLACAEFSEQKNREVFGKCASPNGHGHNYVLEVTVRGQPDGVAGVVLPIERLEGVVKREVIDRFDHKHLNLDCAEFASLNPSVENIAAAIWRLLDNRFSPAKLWRVRVWETAKTYAEIEAE